MSDLDTHSLRRELSAFMDEMRHELRFLKTGIHFVLKALQGEHDLSILTQQDIQSIVTNIQANSASLDAINTEITSYHTTVDAAFQRITDLTSQVQQAQQNNQTIDLTSLTDAVAQETQKIASAKSSLDNAVDEASKNVTNSQVAVAPLTNTNVSNEQANSAHNDDTTSVATNTSSSPDNVGNATANPGSMASTLDTQPTTLSDVAKEDGAAANATAADAGSNVANSNEANAGSTASVASDTPFIPSSNSGTTGKIASDPANTTGDNGTPVPDASKVSDDPKETTTATGL